MLAGEMLPIHSAHQTYDGGDSATRLSNVNARIPQRADKLSGIFCSMTTEKLSRRIRAVCPSAQDHCADSAGDVDGLLV
jgi:hypothetical protein